MAKQSNGFTGVVSVRGSNQKKVVLDGKHILNVSGAKKSRVSKSSMVKARKEQELRDAKEELLKKREEFQLLRAAADASTTTATADLLRSCGLISEVATNYKQKHLNDALTQFRLDIKMNPVKWSQHRRIGQFATELLPHAKSLPCGWSALYTIASALGKTEKNEDGKKVRVLSITQLLDASYGEGDAKVTMTAYTTQSEVRRIVKVALGLDVPEKVAAAPFYTARFDIDASSLNNPQWSQFVSELETLYETLTAKYPFVVKVTGKQNPALTNTAEQKRDHADPIRDVATA